MPLVKKCKLIGVLHNKGVKSNFNIDVMVDNKNSELSQIYDDCLYVFYASIAKICYNRIIFLKITHINKLYKNNSKIILYINRSLHVVEVSLNHRQ